MDGDKSEMWFFRVCVFCALGLGTVDFGVCMVLGMEGDRARYNNNQKIRKKKESNHHSPDGIHAGLRADGAELGARGVGAEAGDHLEADVAVHVHRLVDGCVCVCMYVCVCVC